MMRLILPRASYVIFTRSTSPRAALPDSLAAKAVELGFGGTETRDDALVALDRAREIAGPKDVILITGSFYLAGLLRPRLVAA
jgi:folylpolyglutamate synthase/dihydropteroate synthase